MTKVVEPGKRLRAKCFTEVEKTEICRLWALGKTTVDDLTRVYGRKRETYYNLFGRMGVKRGEASAEVKAAIEAAVTAAVVTSAGVKAQRVQETNEEHYKLATIIAKLSGALLMKARQDKVPFVTLIGDMKTLNIAAATLKITREERYATCDHKPVETDSSVIPALEIKVLTGQDIQRMQAQLGIDGDGIDIDRGLDDLTQSIARENDESGPIDGPLES